MAEGHEGISRPEALDEPLDRPAQVDLTDLPLADQGVVAHRRVREESSASAPGDTSQW